ncbi:MAG: flagellar export chaperone FlgN [Gallionellaceae bacterium]
MKHNARLSLDGGGVCQAQRWVSRIGLRAHHLNHTNGEVIQLKLRSNQQALNALLGAAQNTTALYGRDGQPSLPISGRTLGSG